MLWAKTIKRDGLAARYVIRSNLYLILIRETVFILYGFCRSPFHTEIEIIQKHCNGPGAKPEAALAALPGGRPSDPAAAVAGSARPALRDGDPAQESSSVRPPDSGRSQSEET